MTCPGCGKMIRTTQPQGYCSRCAPRSSSTFTSTSTIPNNLVQCNCCKQNFPDASSQEDHAILKNYPCYRHYACLSRAEVVKHAKMYPHNQCWVPGCTSTYAASKGWDNDKIVAHVEEMHAETPAQEGCTVM